ncbi:1-acyl-sn-glycerol-3-phosphate acyltransferase, partial [Bacteroides thetaiotaomicron]|nr:1-acyl-sn-glycerol-3-phosphate acyltransferase [Bacteroides thetaiotaomicron]
MTAIRKLRLIIHLLRGMATVALRFSHVTPARRAEMTRRWSLKM